LKVWTSLPNQKKDIEDIYQGMPRKYRFLAKLMLKLPNPSIPFFIFKRLPLLEGIFYGIMLPVFAYLYLALMLWLFPLATLAFGFPLNIIIVLVFPTAVFVIFVRIQLERTINWWRSVSSSSKEWDSSKSINEFVDLLKRQQAQRKKRV